VPAVDLSRLRDEWDTFGRNDPLWAVLTRDDAKGGSWDEQEFFDSGEGEITLLMELADELGLPSERGIALDFGCGVGRLTQALARHFDEAIGVDIAPSMLAAANGYNQRPNCRFVQNERADLSIFPTDTFDLIYSNLVLQHMPPEAAKAYVVEFARVLRPGGLAVFSLPTGPSATLRGQLYRRLPHALVDKYKKQRDGATMSMNGVPMEDLAPLVTRSGLRIERVEPDDSPGPNWRGFRYAVSKG
jgi:SAM-dependent methyltransferase